jgi:hypothetical protein
MFFLLLCSMMASPPSRIIGCYPNYCSLSSEEGMLRQCSSAGSSRGEEQGDFKSWPHVEVMSIEVVAAAAEGRSLRLFF